MVRYYFMKEMVIISFQQDTKITVPTSLILDMPLGLSSVGQDELAVYLLMRNWAKPCPEVSEVRKRIGCSEEDWVYELSGYLVNPSRICKFTYNVTDRTTKKYTKQIKKAISTLICANLVVCYNLVTGHSYSGEEYAAISKEVWGTGEDYVFYFVVPVVFYGVSGDNIERIVSYCKKNKDVGVSYFVTLYATLEYYFGISVDKTRCWLISPVSTFFTSHRRQWDRIDSVLAQVGISHQSVQYMDENGEMKTKQVFERVENIQSIEEYTEPEHELPFSDAAEGEGVEEKPEVPVVVYEAYSYEDMDEYIWVDFAERNGYKDIYFKASAEERRNMMSIEEYNKVLNENAMQEWEKAHVKKRKRK